MKKILLLLSLIIVLSSAARAGASFTDDLTLGDINLPEGMFAYAETVAPSCTQYLVSGSINAETWRFSRLLKYGTVIVKKNYGTMTSVTIDWASCSVTSQINVYGSDEPYSEASKALYASDAQLGTLVAECVKGGDDEAAVFSQTYQVNTDKHYAYYAMRAAPAGGNPAITGMHVTYEQAGPSVCAPVAVTLPDGSALTSTTLRLDEPAEIEVACPTEGAVISYTLDNLSGTVSGNPGKLMVSRSGSLTLTASKEGYTSSERVIEVEIPVRPIELTVDGSPFDRGQLRAYGKTSVHISTATPDASISWEYDGKTGTTADLEVEADGTLVITASKDGLVSATRSVVVLGLDPLTSIQAVWDAYPVPGNGTVTDPEPLTVLFDATVVYVANAPDMYSDVPNGQVYITDGTNFSRIFFAGTPVDYKPGDVIAKGWTAKFQRHGGWKEFVPESGLTVASHDGKVPAPRAIGDEDALQALDPGTPVVVKGVILACATSSEIYTGDQPSLQIKTTNSPVALINAFGIASVDSARYDVYGLVDFYGYKRSNAPAVGPTDGDYSHRQWRVAVTEFELWKPTSPRPQFALTNDSEVDSGEPIVITCQDEAATIMYSMDGENYSEYDAANPPVMPAEDVIVSAYSRQEGYHDSAVRRVSLRYSGKAGIADITLDPAGAAEYYDLTGRRVDSPRAGGMYIRVQSGRATKVIL